MNKKHSRHNKLKKKDYLFCRNEITIRGNDKEVRKLSEMIISELSTKLDVGYFEFEDVDSANPFRNGKLISEGLDISVQDKAALSEPAKSLINNLDLVLINAPYKKADAQIQIADGKISFESRRVIQWQNRTGLISEILNWIQSRAPLLNGLILAGGKSSRMEKDKAWLSYHDEPQIVYLNNRLAEFCDETYISCKKENEEDFNPIAPTITDRFLGVGPTGAILSAMQFNPNAAWLVLACDMPFVNEKSLSLLIKNRDPNCSATAFRNPKNELPEPLLAIWEPKSYFQLLSHIHQGETCPRKFLINATPYLINPPDDNVVRNVNTGEEYQTAKRELVQG